MIPLTQKPVEKKSDAACCAQATAKPEAVKPETTQAQCCAKVSRTVAGCHD